MYCKLGCYIEQRSTQICAAGKETYALAARRRRRLRGPTSPTRGNNSRNACIWAGSLLNISSYAFLADIDGDGFPLEKSRTLHDKVLISLGCRDMSYALRRYPPASLGERWRSRAISSAGSSRSGGCLALVIRSVKSLRRPRSSEVKECS